MTPLSRRLGLALMLIFSMVTRADEPAPVESIEGPNGQRIVGRLVGDPATGFQFKPAGAESALRLAPNLLISFAGPKLPANVIPPPFRVELGLAQRISGRLAGIDSEGITLVDGPGGAKVTVRRPGATALVQRIGEVQILADPFERLETGRWTRVGTPEVVDEPRLDGMKSLALPAEGASLTTKLDDPISSGRLDVGFFDDGKVVSGHEFFVDLLFRSPTGPQSVRAILGWDEESLAVVSPGGPALSVQRLARRPGWHRLTIEFGPDATVLSVDGDLLAKGKGTGGPLSELRLATSKTGQTATIPRLAAHFDDLRLVRFAESVPGVEIDPRQDEVRTVLGDQLFGKVLSGTPAGITLGLDGKAFALGWSEVAGLHFQREAIQGAAVEGLLVRARWRTGPSDSPNDLDEAEGALTQLTDTTLSLATPYAGTLTIPRNRMVGLLVLGLGRRIVIDGTAHHLGNEVTKREPFLDPPQPEGGKLQRTFTLESVPNADAFAVLDVLLVVGESGTPTFSSFVKKGELRTKASMNGQEFDFLNRHIFDKNEKPQRIRMPIPPGVLKVGANVLRLEQFGRVDDPAELDDLGILTIAIEFVAPATRR